jgi:hypothetical protein
MSGELVVADPRPARAPESIARACMFETNTQ